MPAGCPQRGQVAPQRCTPVEGGAGEHPWQVGQHAHPAGAAQLATTGARHCPLVLPEQQPTCTPQSVLSPSPHQGVSAKAQGAISSTGQKADEARALACLASRASLKTRAHSGTPSSDTGIRADSGARHNEWNSFCSHGLLPSSAKHPIALSQSAVVPAHWVAWLPLFSFRVLPRRCGPAISVYPAGRRRWARPVSPDQATITK